MTAWPRQLPGFCLSSEGGAQSCVLVGSPKCPEGHLKKPCQQKQSWKENSYSFSLPVCSGENRPWRYSGGVGAGAVQLRTGAVDVAKGSRSGTMPHLPSAWETEMCSGPPPGQPPVRVKPGENETGGNVCFRGKCGKTSLFQSLRQKVEQNTGVPPTPQGWKP